MFSKQELNILSDKYFKVLELTPTQATIKSRNTRHCWILIPHVDHTGKTFKIKHTHYQNKPYHDHDNAATVISAIKKIKGHDHYQMYIRKTEFGK